MTLGSIRLGGFVHGGQVLATAPDGRKVFVWGGLPSEVVDVRITKKKRSYLEGVVTRVHGSSSDRIEPLEPESYLSTSPWQIASWQAENTAKQSILVETFERADVQDIKWGKFTHGKEMYAYRNKIEIGFWGDVEGLHYAHFVRGTHGKQIVVKNALAMSAINDVAAEFLAELNVFSKSTGLRASDLKTAVFRCSQNKKVVAALFVKRELDFSSLKLPKDLQGLVVYFSNPKSPASIPTKKLCQFGDVTLRDEIMGTAIEYDVLSFFQVNIPVFEFALGRIDYFLGGMPKVDMYSGVGAIGIPVGMTKVLVESDARNVEMAQKNVGSLPIDVVQAESEKALEYIVGDHALIVDPPRAGLHTKVIEKIIQVKPPKIAYLSCNPATQARDVKLLEHTYSIVTAEGYNFFPRTPHIESLIILERR